MNLGGGIEDCCGMHAHELCEISGDHFSRAAGKPALENLRPQSSRRTREDRKEGR
jgi:hypothetical protein